MSGTQLRGIVFAGLAALALAAAPRVRADATDGKCGVATKGDSPVARACLEGGFGKAKMVMRDLVKQAKAAGTKFNCDDCHKDTETKFELGPDAREKFKKLLAAALPKK